MKKAIVSVTNDLFSDRRVHRTCMVLTDMGFEVTLVGRLKKKSPALQVRAYNTKRFILWAEKGFLFYAFYNIRLFFFLLFSKSDLLISNDLDTLLPNFLTSRIKKIPLVYDSHEYFTGVPEIQHRPLIKYIWQRIEKCIFPKLQNIITVNQSIADLYKEQYRKELKVVRNISESPAHTTLKTRDELGLPSDKKIIVLQGAGINVDRGGEELVSAMKPEYGIKDTVLYIIGDGDALPVLKNMVKVNKLEDVVFFLPLQSYENLYHYTANADLGVSLDKDTNINYRYSLPNKIFDYIHAQIPVLVSSLVELERIVTYYDIGLVIQNHEPLHIAEKIIEATKNEKKREFWKKNLIIAAQEIKWQNEKKVLIDVFKQFL
ncbi:MAG: glycosyltransferase [Bacteroidales bacterium]|nr:glycosyltransferase [Bacteroidales bacterium]